MFINNFDNLLAIYKIINNCIITSLIIIGNEGNKYYNLINYITNHLTIIIQIAFDVIGFDYIFFTKCYYSYN